MIVFFGPVGAGKSVQGQLLGARLGAKWVSTGNIFRESADPEVQQIIARGELISNEKTYEVLATALRTLTNSQVILDGFPRKKEQAEWLIENQKEFGYSVDACVVIDVPNEEIIERLAGRGRVDDDPEVLKRRLEIYQAEVEPVLGYLSSQKVPVVTVNGVGKVGQIHDRIMDQLAASNVG